MWPLREKAVLDRPKKGFIDSGISFVERAPSPPPWNPTCWDNQTRCKGHLRDFRLGTDRGIGFALVNWCPTRLRAASNRVDHGTQSAVEGRGAS